MPQPNNGSCRDGSNIANAEEFAQPLIGAIWDGGIATIAMFGLTVIAMAIRQGKFRRETSLAFV